jgi:hypothetical protein
MKRFNRASLCRLVTVESNPGGGSKRLRDKTRMLPLFATSSALVASCVELLMAVREIESDTWSDVASFGLRGLGSGASAELLLLSSISAYLFGEGDLDLFTGLFTTSAVTVAGVMMGAASRVPSADSVAILSAVVKSIILV